MSKKIVLLFPGQGAQYPGMGKDFYETFSIARETFDEASDLLKKDFCKLIFEEPEETLKKTVNSQSAIFVTSIAMLRAIYSQFKDLTPFAAAGLSLGEYSALFAAGKIDFPEALFLIQKRAELMSDSCEKQRGNMSAIIGLDSTIIEQVIDQLNPPHQVWIANYNTIDQTVISGGLEGLILAEQKLIEAGAKRVVPLQVQGAFHSGLMIEAQLRLKEFISSVPLKNSNIGLVMNVTGDFAKSIDEMKELLISQVAQSVKWKQGIERLEKEIVELYLEVGPGKTLTMMNRKNKINNASLNVEKISDLEKLSVALK